MSPRLFASLLGVLVCWHLAEASSYNDLPGVPSGYILQITPDCGANGLATDASVNIVTDLNAEARAICSGGVNVNFTTTDGVNFNLPVSYPSGSSTCSFDNRNSSKVYAIQIVVSYGETGSFIHSHDLEYTISCTFDPKSTDTSGNQNIIAGLIAPKELQTNVGSDSSLTFSLNLVDVLGTSLSGQDVPIGKTVYLKGSTNNGSLRPVSCDVIDGTHTYAILRAGCGDGIIFNKTVGFTTIGRTTKSPYFPAFSLNDATVVGFECNFVECPSSNCPGSSCTNA